MTRTVIVGVGGAGCTIAEQLGPSLGHDVLLVNGAENGLERLEEKAGQHRLYLETSAENGRLTTVAGAESAAVELADQLRKILAGNRNVILVVGLGGITGSGAAPELAGVAKAAGMHVTAVATLPFSFEDKRRTVAEGALFKLKKHSDEVVLVDHSTNSRAKNVAQESLNEYFDRVTREIKEKLLKANTGGAS
ncbi:hypothetical protein [Marinobacterium litorale]|uniref:hypothetical protein n=1 Tax=Marinobacterium litorale TaxID=404770 RepID=UPI00146FBFA7|nr:hypothetical protein [Marinobacterium litorale]